MLGQLTCRARFRTFWRNSSLRVRSGTAFNDSIQLFDSALHFADAPCATLHEHFFELRSSDARSDWFVEGEFVAKSVAFFATPKNVSRNQLFNAILVQHV